MSSVNADALVAVARVSAQFCERYGVNLVLTNHAVPSMPIESLQHAVYVSTVKELLIKSLYLVLTVSSAAVLACMSQKPETHCESRLSYHSISMRTTLRYLRAARTLKLLLLLLEVCRCENLPF